MLSECAPPAPLSDSRIIEELTTIRDETIVLCPIEELLRADCRSVPFHEAGHVIVASHLMVPIHSAAIHTDEARGSQGRTFFNEAQVHDDWHHEGAQELVSKARRTPEHDSWDWLGCSFATVCLAGKTAELLTLGLAPDSNTLITGEFSDMICAQRWVGRYRRNAVLLVCQRIAVDILRARWESIVYIANLLNSEQWAARDEIEHLMRHTAPPQQCLSGYLA